MYDVVIIGCGPVGALAANLLGRAGLKTLVVEREADPFPLPRAVHLDHEMMRLFQAAGVIDRLQPIMRDTNGHIHIGADQGVIRYMGTIGRPRPFGWSNDYFFYQPELEDELRQALSKYPNVELRLGTEFISLRQTDAKATITVATQGVPEQLDARWIIACDGSRSTVRKQLAVALEDLDFEEPWLVVDAEVEGDVHFPPLTGVPGGADLQTLSVMMCDPVRPTTIVPGPRNLRRWEFMLLPRESDEEMMQPDKVSELVGPYVEGTPHRLVRAATYRFHGLIAERWQVGRVFLAGDAAHQTPPFFGQGMCHGLRDVANLAWKMRAISQGQAGEALLLTYQEERDPHVRAVISAAVEAGRYICVLDPVRAAERDVEIRARESCASPSTAADLIPPIEQGVIAQGTSGAGERFIQPRLENGRLLDDETGGGWRLFKISPRTVSGDALGATIVDVGALNDRGAVGEWLAQREAAAVLVRPDFYVFGTTKGDGQDLLALAAEQIGRAEEAIYAA